MRGLLFEGLDVSSARPRKKPWMVAISVAIHAAAFALVVLMPLLVTNDVPVTAAPPPTPVRDFPRVRVAREEPARPAPAPHRALPAPAPAIQSDPAPLAIPESLPDPAEATADTSDAPLVTGPGCPDCAPGPPGARAGGTEPAENTGGDGDGPRLVRPGGDIEPPRKLKHVSPIYPPLALAARVGGTVILECVIGVDGRVTSVRVLRGHPLLDAAALLAVQQWQYAPTRLNHEPVAVEMTVTVNFQPR